MARRDKKKSESELLAEETMKMEAKLRVLKAEMTKQRIEGDVYVAGCPLRAGGSTKFRPLWACVQTADQQRLPVACGRIRHWICHAV